MRLLRPRAATTRKWSTSRTATTLLILGLLALVHPAGAGRRKKPVPKPDPQPTTAPGPKAPKTRPVRIFEAALPLDTGPIPKGLANLTAQGCAGCHFNAHADWAGSRHAIGWRDPRLNAAWDSAGTPACQSCHLPLLAQSDTLYTFEEGDVDHAAESPNPAFSASLRLEGVTCAACHVREGKVVGARPPEQVGKAPHPLAWSEELGSSEGCAACHQLTWPGANQPFYDTYGEWKRSPYAAAGVGCVDCHGGPGAGGRIAGVDHRFPRGGDRGVSLLVDLPTLGVVRGGEAVPLVLTLQNTGAGHAFPTGSPFEGVRLTAWLEGPVDKKGNPARTEPFTADLARKISDGAPWEVLEDTRIEAAGSRTFETLLELGTDAPEGEWTLEVQLVQTVRGEPTERTLSSRSLPLRVE